jgi:hypothetical protein
LYCTSATYFLIESSSFFSCRTSSSYGAIYFNVGQCVLYKVCGYDCCTTNSNNYQFGHIIVNNAISNKNYVNYSSIIRCVNENSSPYYMLAFSGGKVCCPSVNISLNKCYYRPGITSWPYGDSNSVTSSFTYSTFADNHAIGYTCFWFNTGGANYEIKSSNILRNTQGSLGSEGTIYINGNLKIEDSCILANTATNTFYQASSSYTITISNCTIDKTTCNLNVVTQNTATKSFILALNHMSNQLCHAQYDAFGTLTPLTPSPISPKKQVHCYTFENFIYQCRLSDFFSFNSIFLFNFIHSEASI